MDEIPTLELVSDPTSMVIGVVNLISSSAPPVCKRVTEAEFSTLCRMLHSRWFKTKKELNWLDRYQRDTENTIVDQRGEFIFAPGFNVEMLREQGPHRIWQQTLLDHGYVHQNIFDRTVLDTSDLYKRPCTIFLNLFVYHDDNAELITKKVFVPGESISVQVRDELYNLNDKCLGESSDEPDRHSSLRAMLKLIWHCARAPSDYCPDISVGMVVSK